MKFRSVFDIIGPIMVGPSSSHTAGAARIGLFARHLFGQEPKNIKITLYGSFKDTYKGHGTDIALIGGLLGYDTYDKAIKTSLITANEKKIKYEFIESDIEYVHPNTAKIQLEGNGKYFEVIGKSIGGGKMVIFEIQGFDVELSADLNTLLLFFTINKENKELLKQEVIRHDSISNYRFSNSVIEGNGLLVIELLKNEDKIINIFKKFSFINDVKYAEKV